MLYVYLSVFFSLSVSFRDESQWMKFVYDFVMFYQKQFIHVRSFTGRGQRDHLFPEVLFARSLTTGKQQLQQKRRTCQWSVNQYKPVVSCMLFHQHRLRVTFPQQQSIRPEQTLTFVPKVGPNARLPSTPTLAKTHEKWKINRRKKIFDFWP